MFLTYARKVIQKETAPWNSKFVFYCAPAKCQTQRKGKRKRSCYYYACALCVSTQRSGCSRFPRKDLTAWNVSSDQCGLCVVICWGRKYCFFCVCSEEKDGLSCNQSGFKSNTETKNVSSKYGSWKFLLLIWVASPRQWTHSPSCWGKWTDPSAENTKSCRKEPYLKILTRSKSSKKVGKNPPKQTNKKTKQSDMKNRRRFTGKI